MNQLRILVLLLPFLTACASGLQYRDLDDRPPEWLARKHDISSLPFFPQDEYQCGPAALATLLTAEGQAVSPEELVPLVYVPERQGSFQTEIQAAARQYDMLAYPLSGSLLDLLAEVSAGNPVLVLQNLGLESLPQWHYAVVKGFDLDRDVIILNSGEIENYTVSMLTFERTWARADRWALLTLKPGDLPATAQAETYFQSLAALQRLDESNPVLLPAYESALQQWPQHRHLLMGFGNHLLNGGNYEDASGIYSEVVALYPDYGPAHNNLAQALMEQSRFAEAEEYVRRALALNDQYSEIYASTLEELRRRKD